VTPREKPEIMRRNFFAFLVLCLACGVGYWTYALIPSSVERQETGCCHAEDTALGLPNDMGPDSRVPVPNNRGPEVVDGFRGEVHPLLHRHAQTEVKAYWVPPDSMDCPSPKAPLE